MVGSPRLPGGIYIAAGRSRGSRNRMNIQYLRYLLGNMTLIAAVIALCGGGAIVWIVTVAVVAIGGPADEAVGDVEGQLSDAQHLFFNTNLYATLPLLVLVTLAILQAVAIECRAGLAA